MNPIKVLMAVNPRGFMQLTARERERRGGDVIFQSFTGNQPRLVLMRKLGTEGHKDHLFYRRR
jgi:hypothetical protein